MVNISQEKQGYKYIEEFGYIPEDWKIKTVKEVASIQTGTKNTEDKVDNGLYPFFVRSQTVEFINDYAYDEEAVLTAGDGVGVGKVFHYINGKFNVHQRVYKISDFKDIIGKYFYLYFRNTFFNEVKKYTAKSSVDSVRLEMIADMNVLVPPLKEQEKIAEVLGDIDSLIDTTQKLINKKKDIKTATMQKLLTPKEDWEEKELGQLLQYEQPTNYIVSNAEYNDNNTIPVLTAGKSFILGYTDETNNIFNKIPVIIFDDFTTESKFVTFPFKVKSSAMKILKPADSSVNIKLVYELMQTIEFHIADHKRYWISEYQYLKIKLPPTDSERNRIATILSDMDSEIEALEKELNKYQNLKTGMMQELLTGKTRLI